MFRGMVLSDTMPLEALLEATLRLAKKQCLLSAPLHTKHRRAFYTCTNIYQHSAH